LTNNTNEIHFNYELAGRSEFGKPLVVSTLTLAIITGLSVADVSASGVNLGWSSVVPTKPVFVGDTLSAESEVVSVRASESRPGDGVLTVRTTGVNQHGEEVMVFERAILIPMREGSADGEG
jgi:itaconyl-CoA hydratase